MTEVAQPRNIDKQFVLGTVFVASFPLFYLLYDLLNFRNDVSSWLAMRLMGVKLLLREQQLYVDFWDWTQPIVFDALKGPVALRDWLEKVGLFFSLDIFMQVTIWLLVLLSSLATGWIACLALKKINQQSDLELRRELLDLSLALVFAISLSSLIMRFDFGDLPHILTLTLAPWTLMRWLAYRGIVLSPWVSMPVGALAAVAACLDLPFIFVFIAIEIALALEKGSLRPALSPDWLAFALAGALYIVHLWQLPEPIYTAFWHWTMPLKMLNYEVYDGSLYGPDACPDRRDILYGMALAVAFSFALAKKNSFFLPLVTTVLCGLGLYILEKQGLSRDLSLVVFGSTASFSLAVLVLVRTLMLRLLPVGEVKMIAPYKYLGLAVASAVVTFIFACALNSDRDRMHNYVSAQSEQSYDDLVTVYNNNQVWKNPVIVISDYPAASYPVLLSLNAEPAGYMLWARPLRLFDWVKRHRILSGPQKDFYNYLCQKLTSDLQSRTAKLIVLQTFERDILNRTGVGPLLDKNYEKGDECRYYSNNHQPREFAGYWYFDRYERKP